MGSRIRLCLFLAVLAAAVLCFVFCIVPNVFGADAVRNEADSEAVAPVSPDLLRLQRMLSDATVFTDPFGECGRISERILQNAGLFLTELQDVLASDTGDLLMLVDKKHSLGADYVPSDLVPLQANRLYALNKSGLSLRAPVLPALASMAEAAGADGIKILVSSTFRSYSYQHTVYNRIVAELGQQAADRESARPGTSQHQLGTAIDFGSISDEFAETAAGKWLASHAAAFGFSLSFPQGYESVTGYRWECWHYRYIGIPAVQFQQKWFNDVQQYMIEFLYAWRTFD